MKKTIEVFSEEETRELGKQLGLHAKPGTVFCLQGDLGTGKTVLAKGMAEGLGVQEDILSPTFMIVREYKSGRLPFAHFDVYRLEEGDELYEIGWEEYLGLDGVILVEWADLMSDVMPGDAVWIRVTKNLAEGTDYRRIEIASEDSAAEDLLLDSLFPRA
ncbi:MAG: tRNA (adenosine(37)-N6)-threonylcarbamoyltransferase complex ATPase subunit type 1 TsaE [Firmicutes bacterium]|nr:tRNA (adenosine(37)-N6)-threonylcarbamoyltransferase complex ATPase subunit type 1 TsaE [Bacillota bacterium]